MRSAIITALSLVILVGAYVFAFGLPQQLVQIPKPAQTVGSSETSASSSTPGQSESAQSRPQTGAGVSRGKRTTTVKTAPLEAQPHTLVLRTIGSARSWLSVDVTSSESGEIVELDLQANQVVGKGDVLIKLDDEAESLALQIANATRDKALDTVTRYRELRRSGNLTITQAELAEAELDLRLAQSNVSLAQNSLDDRTIVAPISGRMGLSELSVGDRVNGGDILVTLDDASKVIAEFEVPERSMALLEVGREVLIGTPTYAGRVFKGEVTAFDSRLDSVTRSATVHAVIDNTEGLLLSGMTLAIRMIDETPAFPIIPATAITWDRNGAGAWVVADNRAERQAVAIRYRDGDSVWVDTDINIGASVVIEGAAKLRAGAQVSELAAEAGTGS